MRRLFVSWHLRVPRWQHDEGLMRSCLFMITLFLREKDGGGQSSSSSVPPHFCSLRLPFQFSTALLARARELAIGLIKIMTRVNAVRDRDDRDQRNDHGYNSRCYGRCVPRKTSSFALRDAPVMTGRTRRSHLCCITSAHTPQGYQVNKSPPGGEKAALLFKIYDYKAAIKAFSSCLIEWTPHQHVFLASLHSVMYQWGLANYQSIRYGGVTVPNEICLTITRSNWTQLSQQFTLSRCCVALWWIMVPVWLTTVMGITSPELLQPWRPPPATRTACAHICSNLRPRLIKYNLEEF